ncbi:uncharacterized protein JCM6883_003989 [Sporobolomyces salmoneus]|uniref:uncharacterized protein n=1 Tax=Sporobolomyces salmoneus TaxID=183962 RepID=UPI00316B2712
MSSLLTAPLDFPLSSLSSLSTTQLALARLHPDSEESDALKLCQLFFHRREKARQQQQQQQQGGGGIDQNDEDSNFALVGLDFRVDRNLEELNEEQLAAVVVLAHPDASELQVLKAERVWRKRREKIAQSRSAERAPERVTEASRVQEKPIAPTTTRVPEPPRNDEPVLPSPSLPLPPPLERPPPALPAAKLPPRQPQPPQSVVAAQVLQPRPRISRPLPPLPSVETRLPDGLCQEIFALKLSNLPIIDIRDREDVSSLFERHLVPDAIILHRPHDAEDVSRTAYVGWLFDFEKRTEAMQEVIRVRMGRWRAMAEFVDSDKPKWEWGDLSHGRRQYAWKVWNEKEMEREYREKVEREEAERRREEEEMVMVVEGSRREERGGGALAPIDTRGIAPSPPLAVDNSAPRGSSHDGEPEAIVLDSPALPPIPISRAPSRDRSSRNDPDIYFPTPTPPKHSLPPVPRVPTLPSSRQPLPPVRDVRDAPDARPPSPRSLPRNDRLPPPPSPTERRDLPPHIAARNSLPSRPSLASSSSSSSFPSTSNEFRLRPTSLASARPLQPQRIESIMDHPSKREPPPKRERPDLSARVPSSSSSTSTMAQDQPRHLPPSSTASASAAALAPPPSLLARTTEIEIHGSAPTPSAASQAKKPSLMDRLNGNGNNGSAASPSKSPASSDRGSPPVPVGPRGQSPAGGVNGQKSQLLRDSPGAGRAGGGGGNSNQQNGARGKGSQLSLSGANAVPQGGSNHSNTTTRQQQQGLNQQKQQHQQQHQQPKGKKRAANELDSQQESFSKGGRSNGGRGGGGANNNNSNASILDRIEGNEARNANGGGGNRGPAKKAKNNSSGGGNTNSRDTDQGGGSSLLSRLG